MIHFIAFICEKAKREKKKECFFFVDENLPEWEPWHNCKELENWATLRLLHFLADFKHLEE